MSSDVTRTSIETNDLNREPTAEELANVPTMTQAEMTEVMKSPEYRNSKLVQKLVAASIAKSNHSAPVTEEPVQSMDDIQAKQATFAALFRDPRVPHRSRVPVGSRPEGEGIHSERQPGQ